MNDHEHFSALVIGERLGLFEKKEIVQLADERISDLTEPPFWMIEFSTEKRSSDFVSTHTDPVIRTVLERAYQKWKKKELSDSELRKSMRTIWNITGEDSDWYAPLTWAEDDLSLVEDGILSREGHIEGFATKSKN